MKAEFTAPFVNPSVLRTMMLADLPLFFLLLAFCLIPVWAVTPSQETQALLSIKSHLLDVGSHLHSWNLSDSNTPCLWSGVACDGAGSITSLDLSYMKLSGYLSGDIAGLVNLISLNVAVNNITGGLPKEIASISNLHSINISNNLFNGSFPADISRLQFLSILDCYNNNFTGRLPLEISQMGSLRHLHLGGNYFEGNIPPQYGNLVNLTYLALSGNSLTGKIPPQLGNILQLRELYLGYYNQFDGGIPLEFGRLANLIRLDVANCGLTGNLPEELGSLAQLDTLFLQINYLSGPIPPSFGNLTSLRYLDLSNNQLTGPLPTQLAKLYNLELLSLFRNKLHGGIPALLSGMPKLQELYLWDNNMTGRVPQRLGRNRRLVSVDLSSNSFRGPIPPYLCAGHKLQKLILLRNFFSGPIPGNLAGCLTLVRLRLGQNLLNGSIPEGLLDLPRLQMMEAPHNNLSGFLPPLRGRNPSLEQLDLSGNQLTGSVPSSIGNLTGLQTFLLQNNLFTGSMPSQIKHLQVLSKMDWSGNLVTGSIPMELSLCTGLTVLDLSRNKLMGQIPAQIQNLTVLDYLNISHNSLSGPIPASLQDMETLTAVDFSFNELTGLIPEAGQFANFNSSSFFGNPGLCGKPLVSQICSNINNTVGASPDDHRNRVKSEPGLLSWIILAAISSLTLLVFAGGVFCNRHALIAMFSRTNLEKPWKLSAFQKLDLRASHLLNCLTEDNIVGKGGAGTVYKCLMPNGEMVAVKRLPGIRKGSSYDHGFSAEIQTLSKIRHRHIVRLLGCCSNEDTNLLVYEYMPNGSLGDLLHGPKGGSLDWPTRYRIAIEAAKGLCYLHHDCCPVIVHRDVKSNNILLDSNFEAHVADFGLAKVLQETGKSESMSSIAGSYGYIAPEYAYTWKVDEKCDIYSFGVVMLELLAGRRPIEPDYGEGGDIAQWVKKMVKTKEGTLQVLDPRMGVHKGSEEMQEVMLALRVALLCSEELPWQRPTMREVVHMLTESPAANSDNTTDLFATINNNNNNNRHDASSPLLV